MDDDSISLPQSSDQEIIIGHSTTDKLAKNIAERIADVLISSQLSAMDPSDYYNTVPNTETEEIVDGHKDHKSVNKSSVDKKNMEELCEIKNDIMAGPSSYSAQKLFETKGRSGSLGSNPYINFLRDFRKRNNSLPAIEAVRKGAEEWRDLDTDTKMAYIKEAFRARMNKHNEEHDTSEKAKTNKNRRRRAAAAATTRRKAGRPKPKAPPKKRKPRKNAKTTAVRRKRC